VSIASRLRGAFLLLTLLLGAVVLVQLRMVRHSAAGEQTLLNLAERHRVASTVQREMIDELRTHARKYVATRDTGYLRRMSDVVQALGDTLAHLARWSPAPDEQASLDALTSAWGALDATRREASAPGAQLRTTIAAALRADTLAASMEAHTAKVAEATRQSVANQLARGHQAARRAAQLSLGITGVAVVVALGLSMLLGRSIAQPLRRIAGAAHAVARGDFSHRLPEQGGLEVVQLSRDVNAMAMRLGEVDRMKREFVSSVSHDLKTPLSSMQEITDALLDGLAGPLTEKQRQLLTYHRESGRRLSGMLAKLLELSRLEARPEASHDLLDLSGLARRAVDHVSAARELRTRNRCRVALDPGDHWIAIRGDVEGVAQLLDNLLENALKFSPAESVITVRLRHVDGDALLSVADEGPGVADAEKEIVFERFHQTRVGRGVSSRGVGLGLAICRQVALAHGGSIVVRDNEPRGAIFDVRLPGALAIPVPGPSVHLHTAGQT